MNRRSFFWFLPALPAAFLAKPAEAQVVAGMDVSSATEGVTITNCYTIASRTDRAEVIRLIRESEQRVVDMARRGGAYSKAIRG